MILCADDFGISPSVDEGILKLIESNRITSTSYMVNSPNQQVYVSELKRHLNRVDVGLHLVLTDWKPLATGKSLGSLTDHQGHFFNLKTLCVRAVSKKLVKAELVTEIILQIEKFKTLFGKEPDYIDGHQHVQQFPIVRDALVEALKQTRNIQYVRTANISNSWLLSSLKNAQLTPAFGNLALRSFGHKAEEIFRKNRIAHNRFLLGYWNLNSKGSFREVFLNYLIEKPHPHDVFFCHPGYVDNQLRSVDPLTDFRRSCLDFLASDEFIEVCESLGLNLNRFKKMNLFKGFT